MNETRLKMYSPSVLKEFRERLNQGVGRKMDLWTVIYTHELDLPVKEHLAECDIASMWTWWAKDILNLESNLLKLKELFGTEKPIVAGCYMWDYGGQNPIPIALMEYQLDKYYEWLKDGGIDGIILCSNGIADLELKTVYLTRQWIKEHGDETL